jgi:hypothetical protein
VLGDSDFVERVLKVADESLERKYQLKSQGYDINRLVDRVAEIYSIRPEEIFQPGKQPRKDHSNRYLSLMLAIFNQFCLYSLLITGRSGCKILFLTR